MQFSSNSSKENTYLNDELIPISTSMFVLERIGVFPGWAYKFQMLDGENLKMSPSP